MGLFWCSPGCTVAQPGHTFSVLLHYRLCERERAAGQRPFELKFTIYINPAERWILSVLVVQSSVWACQCTTPLWDGSAQTNSPANSLMFRSFPRETADFFLLFFFGFGFDSLNFICVLVLKMIVFFLPPPPPIPSVFQTWS